MMRGEGRPAELAASLNLGFMCSRTVRGPTQARVVPSAIRPATLSAWVYRMAYYPSQSQTGDPPAGFYDYLRYLWVADGRRGWKAFGEPTYSTKEAWISFVSTRRMRRYR